MTTIERPKYAPEGALVWCAYWREQYRVLLHNADGSVTIRWETGPSKGTNSTHRTPTDWKRDRILAHNGAYKCEHCDDMFACGEHDHAKVFCGRCAGTGAFITGTHNGKPTGPGGKCFRCMGKGYHTPADRKRNVNYERYGRRVSA